MTTESVAPEVLHAWAIYLQASEEARRRSDRRTGTDHLLLALLEDSSRACCRLTPNTTSIEGSSNKASKR